MKENEIIAKACEAYMLERWAEFRELAARLDARGKVRLAATLYVP